MSSVNGIAKPRGLLEVLWDMVMLTLVDYSSADLQQFADQLQSGLLALKVKMEAETGPARLSAKNIKARKKEFTNMIDASRGSTGHHAQQARAFPSQLKVQSLTDSMCICAGVSYSFLACMACGQRASVRLHSCCGDCKCVGVGLLYGRL